MARPSPSLDDLDIPLARRGEAAPVHLAPAAPPPSRTEAPATATVPVPDAADDPDVRKAQVSFTVRLSTDRYEKMMAQTLPRGGRRRRTGQDILVEALDEWFKSRGL